MSYLPSVIANTLSPSNVQEKFRVIYSVIVKKATVSPYVGLMEAAGCSAQLTKVQPSSHVLVARREGERAMVINKVDENKKSFTRREVKRTEAERRLKAILGKPSERQFRQILSKK